MTWNNLSFVFYLPTHASDRKNKMSDRTLTFGYVGTRQQTIIHTIATYFCTIINKEKNRLQKKTTL